MAGVKRKLEASQEPAATSETGAADTAETSQPAPESPNRGRGSRGTRNARSGRVSRGGRGRGRGSSIGATAEPSTSAQPTSSTQPATTASSNEPETPRLKRTRRSFAIEETPRTTRQSARLKARANSSSSLETPNFQDAIEEAQPEESAVANADVPSGRTRNKTAAKLADSNTAAQNATTADPETQSSASFLPPNTASETAEPSTSLQTRDTPSQSTEPEPSAPAGNLTSNEDQHQNPAEEASTTPQTGTARELRNTPSRSASRKRRAAKMEEDEDIDDSYAPNSASKKPKLEDDEVDRALQQQLQDGTEQAHTSVTPVRESTEPKDQDESRQITEETTASALEDDNGSASNGRGRGGRGSAGRGRGGGGGRGRGGATRGRGGARGGKRGGGRGRGRGRGRGGRGGGRGSKQAEEESDYEEFEERSPSPSPATQKLRERQRELDKAFKKVAAAQRLALAVLAAQSQRRLARDKNAHINAPEYEQVQGELKERLQKKKEQIRRHYELKVEEENILYAANKDLLERQFRASALHIQDEHLLAAQGDYMAFVEGYRQAEDDDHTEPDESDADRGFFPPEGKKFKRGFNSSFVRDPAGAAAYERAASGWEDFVQRAKLGGDISPQMKEINSQEARRSPFAGRRSSEIIAMLIEATGHVDAHFDNNPDPQAWKRLPWPNYEGRPHAPAMFALADAATAELNRVRQEPTPKLRPSAPRAILPQPVAPAPGPTDPRSFLLPPPAPQTQQQRRLLPASIPPINDLFPPPSQLPPPQGSNFQRPGPMPGYLPGPARPLYYPPPPPPPPGSSSSGHRPPY